jgi:anti-sigma regulatory factor (Ser/Thr protein kinase)
LEIARAIQRANLPSLPYAALKLFPQIQLHALMKPAEKVGGDLYDFLLVGPDKLYFVVGDVSGKGIAAAMFMVQTRTRLRGLMAEGKIPSEILHRLNEDICAENGATCMFVTLLLGCLDLTTGALVLSSAGHDSPLLRAPSGQISTWELPRGPACGFMPGVAYTDARGSLQGGAALLLFTDGMTEAQNVSGEFFTLEGVQTEWSHLAPTEPQKELAALVQAVETFAGAAPQSDDIALLQVVSAVTALEPSHATPKTASTVAGTGPVMPRETFPTPSMQATTSPSSASPEGPMTPARRLDLRAELEELPRLMEFAEAPWDDENAAPLSDATLYRLQVVFEELFVNVCKHGAALASASLADAGPDGAPALGMGPSEEPLQTGVRVEVELRRTEAGVAWSFRDTARAFNPLEHLPASAPPPSPPSPPPDLDTIAPGGHGLRLVREFSASLGYRREGGTNWLWGTLDETPAT